jgi:hypothetical protein
MFSLVKWLKSFIASLKKKKGLWFTLLTTVSIAGIALSLFLMTSMTQNVAKDVYVNMSKSYNNILHNRIGNKQEMYERISIAVKSDSALIAAMSQNDANAIDTILNTYNNNYKKSGYKDIKLSFYSALNQLNQYRNAVNSVLGSKNKLFGFEVLSDGIFIQLLDPIYDNDKFVGVLQIQEPITSMKKYYKINNQIFVFALDKKMINLLSIKAKQNKYEDLFEDLKVQTTSFDGKFLASLKKDGEEEFKKLKKVGYIVDDLYYKTYAKASDINGVDIGLFIIGENIEGSGAFVNVVDNMTKQVTTVALGLVISILLFMF